MIIEPKYFAQSQILLGAFMPTTILHGRNIDGSYVADRGIIIAGTGPIGLATARLIAEHTDKTVIVCAEPEDIPEFPTSKPIIIEKLPDLIDRSFIYVETEKKTVKPKSKEARKQINNFNKNSYRKKRRK